MEKFVRAGAGAAAADAHEADFQNRHTLRVRLSVPVAAEFRRGIHGGVFPHQRRDGAGGGISGIARNRRYGAAGSAVDVV